MTAIQASSLPALRAGAIVFAAGVACVIPLVAGDLTFFVQTTLSAIIVTGLCLFMGYAGQASLGQGAFVAAGGLAVAVTTVRFDLPPLVALLLSPVLGGALAGLVGWPLLRLRGHYLAFGTLAVLMLVQVAISVVPLLGGGGGIFGIPPLSIGSVTVSGQLPYAYLALAVLAAVMVVSHNVVRSRFGRGIRALAGSETAAASSGVPVLRSKLVVFVLAGAFAGIAGGIGAFFTPYVSQDTYPPMASFAYIIMAVIGGAGSLWGGVVGAVALSLWLQALSAVGVLPGMPETAGPILQYAGYGLALVVFLILVPDGIVPTLQRRIAARGAHGMKTRRP